MASDSPDQPAGRSRRSLGLPLVLLAAAALASCGGSFEISGVITATPVAIARTAKPNTVMLITAENRGGVLVAVKRIINPGLPLRYALDQDNLVLPGQAWQGPLKITVTVSMHGQVGAAKPGDMRGVHRGTARSGDSHVDVVIDEIL